VTAPAPRLDAAGAAAAHDPRVPPPVPDEEEKQRALVQMKRRATGLLVVAAAVFVVARVFEARSPALGYLRAFAEAAMVGGLADWFAVTALFRHPLGIPIPHTAIVPARKDRIGRSLGRFVQQNFLSREVVGTKLAGARVGERLGRFLADPARARLVARQVAAGLHGAAEVLRDEDVRGFVERGFVSRARRVQVGPLVGRALGLLTAGGRHQELLDAALRLAARAVADHEMYIRERIAAEAPWWVPGAVEDKIHEKVVGALEHTLAEVSADPEHPLRARFDVAVQQFAERLRTSPDTIARAEALKEELLAHPAVREYAGSVWTDVKAALARHAGRALPPAATTPADGVPAALAAGAGDGQAPADGAGADGVAPDAPTAVERGLVAAGNALLADPALTAKVDGWVREAVLFAIEQYRAEAAQFIESTVSAWDPAATSQRIETQIGRDLQFIRINGTLVGGLVGVLLYALGQLADAVR
jgi:uncharacterized membrane-anchored protein YjiN (DUF445 family)